MNIGTGRERQILFLIIAAGSTVVIGTLMKTYPEQDILLM